MTDRATSPVRSRRLLAAALLAPALVLTGCGGGGSGGGSGGPSTAGAVTASGPASAQTATVVGQSTLKFAPETVRAKVGTLALTLRISGGVPHDLVFDDAGLGAPIPVVPSGSSTSTYTFRAPGTYRFVCTLHAGMVGQVVVS